MLININDIKINPGRREAAMEDVQRLSESVAEVGMMNPITVTSDYTLVAGLDHYREILSPQQIKAMIAIAKSSIKILQNYVDFLNNELEVSE